MPRVTKVYCDCCGEEIENTVYCLQIWAEGVKTEMTSSSIAQNVHQNLSGDRTYCSKCIGRLKKEFNY